MKKKPVKKMQKGGAVDGINMHKAMAMGKPVTGKKKGGSVKDC